MSRYIDADAIKEDIDKSIFDADDKEWYLTLLANTPSIDLDTDVWCEDCKEYDKEHHNCPRFNRVIRTALEDAGMVRVVRCKECKHRTDSKAKSFCEKWLREVDADVFCSYGQKERTSRWE